VPCQRAQHKSAPAKFARNVCYVGHSLENAAKLARVREFPQAQGYRRADDADLFGSILQISLRGEVNRGPSASDAPLLERDEGLRMAGIYPRGEVLRGAGR